MEALDVKNSDEKLGNAALSASEVAENDDQIIHGSQQFVTFAIGDEEYAVDIMQVREIQAWSEVTVLPNQPEYMRGVLNLRGIIVPIFDLRCRFKQGRTEASPVHVVVIIAIGERIIGVLVDRVSDILTVEQDDIRPVPDMDDNGESKHLMGLVTAEERMVALLNTESLFNKDIINPSISGAEQALAQNS
ncbi:chemotaxis protein CheW [Sneathiella limimaris]|uniref:chemotaxis protein CheW n=1 Tax=Sneathiella limimaris TaxID=1964213 RepID=UPI00146A603E|nr:chemotaxis protein CheW [Sneathiella limimaris]